MSNRRQRVTSSRRLSVAEVLEPRVLYSADAVTGLLPLLVSDELSTNDLSATISLADRDEHLTTTVKPAINNSDEVRRIVFVDTSIPSPGTITQSINDTHTRLVQIEPDEDGLLAISRALSELSDLESVQIVSHGSPGALQLGASRLDMVSLEKNQAAIERWGNAIHDDGDIVLLGCDVASGASGTAFVDALSHFTRADVAASTDVTGHEDAGGNWQLEYATGLIDGDIAITAVAQQQWTYSLASITVDTTTDQFDIPSGTTLTQLLTLQALGEEVSLREAVYAASQGAPTSDTIILGAGTYRLTISGTDDSGFAGDLDIRGELEIIGQGFSDTIIVENTSNTDRVIDVVTGDARFVGLQITGGDDNQNGGGIYGGTGTSITLVNSLVTGNHSDLNGGGIYTRGSLIVENSAISGNTASGSGAGVYSLDSVDLSDSTVFNNTADDDAGGVYADTITVSNSSIGNNSAAKQGGAFYALTSISISDIGIQDNQAEQGAGIYSQGSVDIVNGNLSRNQADGKDGGAVYSEGAVTVLSSQFNENYSDEKGGAIYAEQSVSLQSVSFDDNQAVKDGGAVYAAMTLNITDSSFTSNDSQENGGAVYAGDDLTIARASFVSNNADQGRGGAIYKDGTGSLDLTNLTFSQNNADEAGAIYTAADGEVMHTTFVGNTASSEASTIWANGATVIVNSSIFQQNLLNGALDGAVSTQVLTSGWNIFDFSSAAMDPTDLPNTDALLGPLDTVDGMVNAYSLLPGSPAINAGGSNPAVSTDSQGKDLDEIPDIGAFEYDGSDSVVFWTDGAGDIYRSNVDFTNVQLLIAGRNSPTSIAAIKDEGLVYWLEEGSQSLMAFAMDGTGAVTSVLSGLMDATSISVDAAAAHVYVAFAGSNPRIDRFDLNTGALLQSVVTTDIASPVDVEFHANSQRLYWAERGDVSLAATVRSTDLNGGDLMVHQPAAGPTSIAVDLTAASVYWGDNVDDSLGRLDVNTGASTLYPTTPDNAPGAATYDEASDRVIWSSDATDRLLSSDGALSANLSVYSHSSSIVELTSTPTSFVSSVPVVVTNVSLNIVEGQSSVIDNSTLASTDLDTSDELIAYHVSGGLSSGFLTVDGVANATDFTQQHIDDGLVVYTHDGSESLSDTLTFTLSDGARTTLSSVLSINIIPVDDSPTLSAVATPIVVLEGGSYTLSASELLAADVDTASSEWVYRLSSAASAGSVEVGGVAIDPGTTFTQAQLLAGEVVYRHDGGETSSDSIAFIVNDGNSDSGSATVNLDISPVDDSPTLSAVGAPITVLEGGSYTLSASELPASDVDTAQQ